jgi:Rps23 Pro-64 3,4-dihydroxylase Tpa1-like proline 4-hydroxylase
MEGLLDRAVSTLNEALDSPELSLRDRTLVALRVLELAHGIDPIEGLNTDGWELPQLTQRLTSPSNQRPKPRPESHLDARLRFAPNGQPATGPDQPHAGSTTAQQPAFSYPVAVAPVSVSNTQILEPTVLEIDNFLSHEEHQFALSTALNKADQFVGSKTTTNASDYRRSSILYATLYPDLYELLRQRLIGLLPTVMQQLGMPGFEPGQVEMQLTAHNDGCFYKIHNDSGSPETATRVLTYVYYFYQEPKRFSGGELRMYETDISGPMVTASDHFETIEPLNNRIVFFDSRCKHEVLPVVCPSRQFDHGRFTLNGWIRRA